MESRRIFQCVLGVAFGLSIGFLMALPAQAVSVTTTVNGVVNIAQAGNPFGLSAGDSVTAEAVYDDAGIPDTGVVILNVDNDPAFSLTITFGSFMFEETDVDLFGLGFPKLQFFNGSLQGFDFSLNQLAWGGFPFLQVGVFGSFILENITIHDQFFVNDLSQEDVFLEGTWNFTDAKTVPSVPLPEPSTWLLFGTGFVGLLSYNRIQKRRGQ